MKSFFETLEDRRLLSAPFAIGGSPNVHAQDFRITTFASGMNFPNGMTRLSDGSFLATTAVPTDAGGYFGNANSQIVRLTDTNHDGIADGIPQVLYQGLPPFTTDVRVAGNYIIATSAGGANSTINILKKGKKASSPLTLVSSLTLTFFTSPWKHLTYALDTRPTPGSAGSYDIFFNVGSEHDAITTSPGRLCTITSSDGFFAGSMHPDSIYMLTMTPQKKGSIVFNNLRQVAFGLRNAAGIAIQPGTGDLYLEDNGINGGVNGDNDPQLSADEINYIPFADIGNGTPPNFGFADDYIVEATGQRVGSGATQPLVAYTPVNGSFAEGPQDIAHAPAAFPEPLNHGIFTGFFGNSDYTGNGLNNPQNPISYFDRYTGSHFDFISNNEAAIGHPVGWLSTSDSLFFSDLAPTNDFNSPGTGAIYQIQAKPRTATMSGTAFLDSNQDGIKGKGEIALPGQTLYIDYNGNGTFDDGDVSTVTDGSGNYRFKVPVDSYRIRMVIPQGYHATGVGFADSIFKKSVASGMNLGIAVG